MPKGRCWSFTSFSECSPAWVPDDLGYLCYQRERARTGREHWQGYCEFLRAVSQGECKEILGRQCHVELARGGLEQNKAYCSKEDTRVPGAQFVEFGRGVGRQPGQRSDLRAAAEACRDSRSVVDLCGAHPELYVKYHRGFHALIAAVSVPRDRSITPDVRVYHGSSGAGKTRSVYDEFPTDQIYQKDGSKWWDGYVGQRVILFDDFSGSSEIPPTELLRITDRYPHGVEVKGSRMVLGNSIIIFTCMVHWGQWYGAREEWQVQRVAFERRVTCFREFSLPVDGVPVGDEPLGLDRPVVRGL